METPDVRRESEAGNQKFVDASRRGDRAGGPLRSPRRCCAARCAHQPRTAMAAYEKPSTPFG